MNHTKAYRNRRRQVALANLLRHVADVQHNQPVGGESKHTPAQLVRHQKEITVLTERLSSVRY